MGIEGQKAGESHVSAEKEKMTMIMEAYAIIYPSFKECQEYLNYDNDDP